MLYYNFDGYLGFQSRFGIVEHGNGEKSRKNKILLAYIKQPSLFKEAVETGDYSLINIASMSELKQTMLDRIMQSGEGLKYEIKLINYTFHSSKFETDVYKGLCEDGDPKACRYINHNNGGRAFKMKAGKFFRSIILETEFGQTLPEQVLVWLCEEFAAEWQTFTLSTFPENKLYVNDNFSDIYDSERCVGNFHSCMTDQGYHTYYQDSVKAKAAYLENDEGNIIARCVIFPEVYDENGKVWRLAERQYSTDCDDVLKRALVDALIRGNFIDGYKKVGAGCSDTREFVDINGNSLADKKFYIDCSLETYETLSYQDSFRYYNYGQGKAYNYQESHHGYCLDTTDGSIDGNDDDDDDEPQEYDSYHQCNAWVVCTVWVHGERETCDVDDIGDFIEINGSYYHEDDVSHCDKCGEPYLPANGKYSGITDGDYCCDKCRSEAEQEFIKENWFYSFFDKTYFEDKNDLATYLHWDWNVVGYVEKTISKYSLDKHSHQFHLFDGVYYDRINPMTDLPYYAEETEDIAA